MKERERLVATGLVTLMLVLWLGFLVHRSPRFAGSAAGGALGVSGALLMLVPLAYLLAKRSGSLRRRVTRRVSMRTLLTWHIYAGIAGPVLALLHSGHRFESPLGVALTALMLVVVLSGFVGRYLLGQVSGVVLEKREQLTRLEAAYREAAGELAASPEQVALLRPFAGFFGRMVAPAVLRGAGESAAARAMRLADAMADIEYAIGTHERFRVWFSRWLGLHIAISAVLYLLLALHVWSAIYYGLRWFS